LVVIFALAKSDERRSERRNDDYTETILNHQARPGEPIWNAMKKELLHLFAELPPAERKEKLKGLKRSLDYSDTALKQMNTELIAMLGPFV
jgi:hypothetical protein